MGYSSWMDGPNRGLPSVHLMALFLAVNTSKTLPWRSKAANTSTRDTWTMDMGTRTLSQTKTKKMMEATMVTMRLTVLCRTAADRLTLRCLQLGRLLLLEAA
mmetsp:Transcript_5423/g.13774  ORF Transcript_5423/g.13774 Transcript_5423/m.13774 type:complete len:102 (+) Transcript_5423:417-722(+)